MTKEEDEKLKLLSDTFDASVEEFDKIILPISSGAFGIAFAFTDKIVQFDEAEYKPLFICALVLFVLPVLLAMLNYFREILVLRNYRTLLIRLYNANAAHEAAKNSMAGGQDATGKVLQLKEQAEKLNHQANVRGNASNDRSVLYRFFVAAFIVAGSVLLLVYIIINT